MSKKVFFISLFFFLSLIPRLPHAVQPDEQPLINFSKGNEVSLADYKSKLLLLNFWAPWCVPCRREFPELQKLQDKHPKSNLFIIGITAEDDQKKIKRFIEQTNISFPILFDRNGKLHEKMKVEIMPTTLLLNRKREIIGVYQGFEKEKSFRRIEQEIEKHLLNTTK